MTLTDRTLDILGNLIAIPTVSSVSNLEMIHRLSVVLERCGARVFLDHDPSGAKANLFATLGPDTGGGVLLSGHTDVVPVEGQDWTRAPFAMEVEDGRIYGRGTCDMKGFIAAALAVAETVDAGALTKPLHFGFTYDEETGCIGATQLVAVLRDRGIVPEITIVGEPTEMRIIEGHKGCCEYGVDFKGRAGHGSAPDHGVNAAEYAARYVARLLDLRDALKARAPKDGPFDPPWSTINVGRIQGGVATNVIAEQAQVFWETRPVQAGDLDFVKDAMTAYCDEVLIPAMRAVDPDAGITTTTIGEVIGLTPLPDNAARDLLARLTGANTTDLVAFGTEAGLFQELGSDVIVCGPGSIAQAHTADEYLALGQLEACLDVLVRLVKTLS